MIYGDVLSFGGSGVLPKINVSGLLSTDSVVATMGSKSKQGKWIANTPSLPSGYTKLKYIQSSGTQYINTGINEVSGNKLSFKYAFASLNNITMISGFYTNTSQSITYIGYYWTDLSPSQVVWSFGSTHNYAGSADLNVHEVVYQATGNSLSVNFDGTDYNFSGTKTYSGLPYYIGGRNTNGSAGVMSSVKIYNWKIEDSSSNILINLIPCKRNSDDAIGMYDLVSNTFFGNSGTGTFTAGEVDEGIWQIPISDFGTWQVTATDSGVTKHLNVMVDTVREYDVDISDFS